MNLIRTIAATFFVTALLITLPACDDQGPMEEAGEEMDDTVDEAGDSIDDATDDY